MKSQLENDPEFKKFLEDWLSWTPPKSKIRIFLDKNLPIEVIEEFKELKDIFKITGIASKGEDDRSIFNKARKLKALIITRDLEFWDDKKFPIKDSPGTIIVKGNNPERVSRSLGLFFENLDIIDAIRKIPDWATSTKWKISLSGYIQKILTRESNVEIEKVKY